MSKGTIVTDAPVGEAIDAYLGLLEQAASEDLLERADRHAQGRGMSKIRSVVIRDVVSGTPDVIVGGRPATITIEVTEPLPEMECLVVVANSLGQPVTRLDSRQPSESDVRSPERPTTIECEIPSLPLLPGRYRLDVRLHARESLQDGLIGAAYFDVEPGVVGDRPMHTRGSEGDVQLAYTWRLPEA